MNEPYCETIAGEVSIRKMYAGGLSYFSSGSLGRGIGESACPQAAGSAISEPRQANRVVAAKNNEEKMRCNRDGVNMLSGCAIIELVVVLAFGERAKRIPAFDRNLTRASNVGREARSF